MRSWKGWGPVKFFYNLWQIHTYSILLWNEGYWSQNRHHPRLKSRGLLMIMDDEFKSQPCLTIHYTYNADLDWGFARTKNSPTNKNSTATCLSTIHTTMATTTPLAPSHCLHPSPSPSPASRRLPPLPLPPPCAPGPSNSTAIASLHITTSAPPLLLLWPPPRLLSGRSETP